MPRTLTTGPAGQTRPQPAPRIDTTWTFTRSADGSIAIVTRWHFEDENGRLGLRLPPAARSGT
jgi:hypothetical protein